MKSTDLTELQRLLDTATVNSEGYVDKGVLTVARSQFDLFQEALAYIGALEQKQEAIEQITSDMQNVADALRIQFDSMQSDLDRANAQLETIELLAKDLGNE